MIDNNHTFSDAVDETAGPSCGILLDIFTKQQSGIHFCHLNARSLLRKMDDFRFIFRSQNIDVIMVSETWLNNDLPDELINLPGYRVVREDRCDRRGGGVAIFVRENLCARFLGSSCDGVEFLFVELSIHSQKILTACVYIPPSCNDWSRFEESLGEHSSRYMHVIIGGDFNANLLAGGSRARRLRQMVSCCDLHIINDNTPTHFSHAEPSLLDLFITSQQDRVLFGNQISLHDLSDHDLIFITYNIPPPARNAVVEFHRNYKDIKMDELLEECLSLPWSDVFYITSPDEQVRHFSTLCQYLFEKYVPLKRKRVRLGSPWFNDEMENLILERDYLYQKYRRSNDRLDYNRFVSTRKLLKTKIKRAKRAYYARQLNVEQPPKKLWASLKEIGALKSSSKTLTHISPDEFNQVFTSSMGNVPTSVSNIEIPAGLHSSAFSIHNVSVGDVFSTVHSIKSNAVGLDGVCPRFVKIILPLISTELTHIFNTCITTSSFPKQWKIARVVPIPKINKASSATDYRPISITPFLSKVLEKLVGTQIKSYLEQNKLLCDYQSGFRGGHSTTTALLKIIDDIRVGIDENSLTVLTLLDFTKAFDSVDHQLLINKLNSSFGFGLDALKFFASYLTDRVQQVDIDGKLSIPLPVLVGVPQGTLDGPVLFSMFVNDISLVLKHCQIHMYADDIQIYIQRPLGLIEDAVSRLNEDLSAILKWSQNNKLRLNPQKCNSIIIYREKIDYSQFPSTTMGCTIIPYKDRVRNLGLIMNDNFDWTDHVNSVIQKIYGGLRRLWMTAYLVPRSTRLKLIQALIIPIISYGDVIYAGLDSSSRRRLNVAFNDCVRYVFLLRRYDHVSPFALRILGLPLDQYFRYRICIFIDSLLRFRRPLYLYEKLRMMSSSGRSGNLILPRFRSLSTGRSFFVHGVRIYNELPSNIKHAGSAGTFKQRAFQFLSGN